MNGVYLQLHAYMLRIAIPYGTLSGRQMRKLAFIARTYDKNYGHFTTRQNLQFNWPALKDVPDILAHLAEVEMHAIQTSGNCIRNVTADHFAGVAADEIIDPTPVIAEIMSATATVKAVTISTRRGAHTMVTVGITVKIAKSTIETSAEAMASMPEVDTWASGKTSPHGASMAWTVAPQRSITSFMRVPKTPLTHTIASSPGSSRLTARHSMPAMPVPLTGKVSAFLV